MEWAETVLIPVLIDRPGLLLSSDWLESQSFIDLPSQLEYDCCVDHVRATD